jgi:hypothetical protein
VSVGCEWQCGAVRCGGPAQVSEQIVTRPRECILSCPPSLHPPTLTYSQLAYSQSVDFFDFVFVESERMSISTFRLIIDNSGLEFVLTGDMPH